MKCLLMASLCIGALSLPACDNAKISSAEYWATHPIPPEKNPPKPRPIYRCFGCLKWFRGSVDGIRCESCQAKYDSQELKKKEEAALTITDPDGSQWELSNPNGELVPSPISGRVFYNGVPITDSQPWMTTAPTYARKTTRDFTSPFGRSRSSNSRDVNRGTSVKCEDCETSIVTLCGLELCEFCRKQRIEKAEAMARARTPKLLATSNVSACR